MTAVRLLMLLLLSAIATPVAGADDGCDNHGAIVQAGADNRYACAGRCGNDGVVVMAGPGNRFDCQGGCEPGGVVVNLGGSHCGDGTKACVGETCVHACRKGCEPTLAFPEVRAG